MLDLFRKRGLSSVVYAVVIAGTLLVFVIGFRPNAGQKTGSIKEACAATVRGFCIDPKSLRASYRMIMPRGRSGEVLTARARQMQLSRIALDGLVERELLVGEAERLGLTVTEDEVTESIFDGFIWLSLPSDAPDLGFSLGIPDGHVYAGFKDPKTKEFDLKVYERNVKALTGRSPQEFREWQQRELLAAKVRDLVRAPVRVSDDEAFDAFVSERTTASVGYVEVKTEWVEKWAVDAPAAAVDAWMKDRANAAQVKTMIRHVLIKPAGESDSDAGLDQARTLAEQVLTRAKKGEDFEKLAAEYSKDPGSAKNGGAVGTETAGFVEPFRDAADKLQPGEILPALVDTQFGFHVIKKDAAKREDIEAAYRHAKGLEVAKELASKVLAELKAGKSEADAVEAVFGPLFKKSRTVPRTAPEGEDADGGAPADAGTTTETAGDDPNRPRAETTSGFNRGGDPVRGVGGETAQRVRAFAFDAKPGALFEEPVRSDDGFVLVRVKEQHKADRAEFDKERDAFSAELLARKQAEALVLYVKRLREAAKGEITVDENNIVDGSRDAGAAPNPFGEDEE